MGLQRVREKLTEVVDRARQLPSAPNPPETVELEYGDAAYLYDIADSINQGNLTLAQEYLYDWETEHGEEAETKRE